MEETYILLSLIICILYFLFEIRKPEHRLLMPSIIHTLTWFFVTFLIYLTINGHIGKYNVNDPLWSYTHVAPFIMGLVISSIAGFSLSHLLMNNDSNSVISIDDEELEYYLQRYHWILYVCLILGIFQTVYLLNAVGFNNLGDYRIAAVTMKRTGIGAFAQQFSGHATILGTFYISLLGYQMGRTGIRLKRFIYDTFLLASTNLAIAGRGWILVVLVPFMITFLWQKQNRDDIFWNADTKRLFFIFLIFITFFSLIGQIRSSDAKFNSATFFDKFLYYTDGSRVTNYMFSQIPDGSFQCEYGKCELLGKWIDSPMTSRFVKLKSRDIGLSVTVSSSMPYLYFDYGWWGGIIMWGFFCFLLESIASSFRYKESILSIIFFTEVTKILFQSPVGNVIMMEIPVLEWMLILYLFRNHIFSSPQ